MNATPLAEELGPRARRQVQVVTAAVVIAAVLGAGLGLRRLQARGQLDVDLWQPLRDPAVIRFLLVGLVNTVRAAAAAMAISLVFGLGLALARQARHRVIRLGAGAYTEFFRSVPLVLLVLFCSLGLPVYGINIGGYWYLVLALSVYNSAVVGEIIRAGILAVERGQSEAASAIGLGYWQALGLVVLPQALRRMAPAIVSQLVTLLKDTSLGAVIPFEELLRRGRITGEFYGNPLQALFVVALIYIAFNVVFSRGAERV